MTYTVAGHNQPHRYRAFTLIEIVIAISMIAIFTTLPIFAYTNYLRKARDNRRVQDINQIQSALELYKDSRGNYPQALPTLLIPPGYIPEIPLDPREGETVPGAESETFGYKYLVDPDGKSYFLSGALEDSQGSEEGLFYTVVPGQGDGIAVTGVPVTSTPRASNTPVPSTTIRNTPTYSPSNAPTTTATPSPAWKATNLTGAPTVRWSHSAIWTGNTGNSSTNYRMIVWGGTYLIDPVTADTRSDGGIYNPASDAWAPVSSTGSPTKRTEHTAVWTGSRMIVWGGADVSGGNLVPVNTGASYDPGADSWSSVQSTGAPAARYGHTATWAGNRMIVWGGYGAGGTPLNTGAMYTPGTNSWSAITTTGAPAARGDHTAVWTGSRMIVWGGYDNSGTMFDTGAVYNPTDNTWTAMSTTGAPPARFMHSASWTGGKMVVYGGRNLFPTTPSWDTAIYTYDPNTNSWESNTAPYLYGRYALQAVSDGTRFIAWGGGTWMEDGLIYQPASDTWAPILSGFGNSGQELRAGPPAGLAGRYQHTTVWTGSTGTAATSNRIIVWGGDSYGPTNRGGVYSVPTGAPVSPGSFAEYTVADDTYDIAAGSGNYLWYTTQTNKIGRISTSGTAQSFTVPSATTISITRGRDGNSWYTTGTDAKIGKISAAGTPTEYTVPSETQDLVHGSDNHIWYTTGAANNIGRMTLQGIATEYDVGYETYAIAVAPDGAIWFTTNTTKIGKMPADASGTVTIYDVPWTATDIGSTFWPGNVFVATGTTSLGIFNYVSDTPSSTTVPVAFQRLGHYERWGTLIGTSGAGSIGSHRYDYIGQYAVTSSTYAVTQGPDGYMWYTTGTAKRIGKIMP